MKKKRSIDHEKSFIDWVTGLIPVKKISGYQALQCQVLHDMFFSSNKNSSSPSCQRIANAGRCSLRCQNVLPNLLHLMLECEKNIVPWASCEENLRYIHLKSLNLMWKKAKERKHFWGVIFFHTQPCQGRITFPKKTVLNVFGSLPPSPARSPKSTCQIVVTSCFFFSHAEPSFLLVTRQLYLKYAKKNKISPTKQPTVHNFRVPRDSPLPLNWWHHVRLAGSGAPHLPGKSSAFSDGVLMFELQTKVWSNAELYCSPPFRIFIHSMIDIYTSFQMFPQSCRGVLISGISLSVPNLSFESLFRGAQGCWLLCQLDLPKVKESRSYIRICQIPSRISFFSI